jgi:hypothetical protein
MIPGKATPGGITMSDRKRRAKRAPRSPEPEHAPKDSVKSKHPVGIDNRNESTRRYGDLEPDGYTRHLHGNREGEFQSGGKANPELPIEESAPMKEAPFRKGKDTREVPPDSFGGRTFDDLLGDHDIIDDMLKGPPEKRT